MSVTAPVPLECKRTASGVGCLRDDDDDDDEDEDEDDRELLLLLLLGFFLEPLE